MNHDPELPNGLQDADLDMLGLENAAARARAIEKAGGCAHGARRGSAWGNGIPCGWEVCSRCGMGLKIPPPLPAWY